MDTATITAQAFNEMAVNYEAIVDGELRRFWGWRYDDFVEAFLQDIPAQSFESVLDIATGTVVIPRKLIQQKREIDALFGLDLTMGMLRSGQKQLLQQGAAPDRVHLMNANALAMPYEDGSFDLVICCLATHHMGTSQMLSEMNRVLKPGGLLLLADVCAAPYWRWKLYRPLIDAFTLAYFTLVESIARAKAEMASFPNILTPQEWEEVLEKHGFTQVLIRKLHRKFFWIPNPVIIKAKKKD